MSLLVPVFKILPTVNQYDWGKTGLSSKAAQLAQTSGLSNFSVNEKTPYSEVSLHPSLDGFTVDPSV